MDNLTEEERRLKVKPENAPDKAESIRRFAMSVKINGLQNKVQKDVAYNHLLAYAAMVERCEEVRKFSFYLEDGHTSIDHIIKPQINYILKGETNERK